MTSHARALGIIAIFFVLFSTPARAVLTIEITQGADAGIPIAVVPFQWNSSQPEAQQIGRIISDNLHRSGRFDLVPEEDFLSRPHDHSQVQFKDWRLIKSEALVVGLVNQLDADRYEVRFQLLDVFKERQLAGYRWEVDKARLRKVAHQISDLIYEELTGEQGAFDTRIAYVTVEQSASQGASYLLMVADSDGHNAREILRSTHPILSPAWAPNGRSLAYVSFEDGSSKVIVQDVVTGSRQKIAEYPGLNSAPAWAPDGRRIAMTLSRDGNPEIYVINLSNGGLTRMTRHHAIDTEPSWSPDGREIVFTSDRGGQPQIYKISAAGGAPERLTFEGRYNARASFSPKGDRLTLVTNQGNGFSIGVFYLSGGEMQVLTNSRLDESPTFAPNGGMVLYATKTGNRGVLAAVSSDGRVKQVLKLQDGSVREPAWSPFNRKL